MKVMKSLENRGILLKGTTKKLLVKKEDISFFFTINGSRFTINEKSTYASS